LYALFNFQSTFKCPAEGLLNEKKIHEMARKQLEMEMATVVKVKSIDIKSPPTQKVLNYVRI